MSMRRLGELRRGDRGRIAAIRSGEELARRMMEMGILEGAWVEVMHEAPFGGDPLAIRVRGALVALRREEADLIEVAEAQEARS